MNLSSIISDYDLKEEVCSRIQRGAFDLPLWAHESIYGEEDTSDLLCKPVHFADEE